MSRFFLSCKTCYDCPRATFLVPFFQTVISQSKVFKNTVRTQFQTPNKMSEYKSCKRIKLDTNSNKGTKKQATSKQVLLSQITTSCDSCPDLFLLQFLSIEAKQIRTKQGNIALTRIKLMDINQNTINMVVWEQEDLAEQLASYLTPYSWYSFQNVKISPTYNGKFEIVYTDRCNLSEGSSKPLTLIRNKLKWISNDRKHTFEIKELASKELSWFPNVLSFLILQYV
jgi:hypothetical protein